MRLALSRSRGCGSRERIIAVRAKATTGFISGKQATRGRRVKPIARRAGTTISRALQIVGVSQARSASRLWRSGRLGIMSLRPVKVRPGFRGNAVRPQGLFRRAAFAHHLPQQTRKDADELLRQ